MTKPNEPEGLCALCGHARHRHGSGYPATCPIIPTYRAPTQPVADAGGVTEDDVIGLINIVTDLAEVDALDKAYPEVWGRLDAMVNHAVAAATAAKDAAIRARDDHFRNAQRLAEKLVAKDAEVARLRDALLTINAIAAVQIGGSAQGNEAALKMIHDKTEDALSKALEAE